MAEELLEGFVEIEFEGVEPLTVLEEIARISYETAPCPLHHFVVPFEIEATLSDLSNLIKDNSLCMDYVNGRLCGTYAFVRGRKVLFDKERFLRERGSPEIFLILLRERVLSKVGATTGG